MDDLICISHLRWDFVWQRPQHLLSRFAQQRRVVFVEEPVTTTDTVEPYLEVQQGHTPYNLPVTVIRLVQPADHHHWIGHGDPLTQDVYGDLLSKYLRTHGYHDGLLWLYTPMALEFADTLPHKLLIFDVMDQLSAFKGAPAELIEKEKQLLHRADVVFTGGVSLYRSKLPFNPNTYLFPSGVEISHYATAARRENFAKPAELDALKGPVLGYFGVIDERMDLGLLAHLAQAKPEYNLVMIGPTAKIGQHELPQAPNIHYLGMRSYEELPAYLAHFDVALIPFALNEATRYLSPTKTLEYMAAHKPIVSTPIHDVIELYGEVVHVGHTHDEFVSHIQKALTDDAKARYAKETALLANHTWESIVYRMNQTLQKTAAALKKGTAKAKTLPAPSASGEDRITA